MVTRIDNLQLTVSCASDEVTFALTSLLMTHLYLPSSVLFKLVIVREDVAFLTSPDCWTVSLEPVVFS